MTEALFPVERAQTDEGAVMVQLGDVLSVHAVLETSSAPSSIEALAVLHIWVQSGVPVFTVVWNCTVPDPPGGICAFIYHLILLILAGAGSVAVQVVPLSVENNLMQL